MSAVMPAALTTAELLTGDFAAHTPMMAHHLRGQAFATRFGQFFTLGGDLAAIGERRCSRLGPSGRLGIKRYRL
jgi:hypothetical protein